MEMSGKADTPFSLKALMMRDKKDLELEKFAGSKIKADMYAGTLKPGGEFTIGIWPPPPSRGEFLPGLRKSL